MIEWIRPSGNPLTTNDSKETIEYCKAKGWKRVEGREILPAPKEDNVTRVAASKAVDKVKRTRRTKAQMEEARNGNGSTSN